MHEARTRAGLDDVVGLREVDAAALGKHQGLASGAQMDEGKHIGDHLDHRRLAERPDMENLAAHRFKRWPVFRKHFGAATDDHCNVTRRRKVHPTCHGALQHLGATRMRHRRKTIEVGLAVGAHLDPGGTLLEALENAALASQHLHRHGRGR